jgi:hypothetical protein
MKAKSGHKKHPYYKGHPGYEGHNYGDQKQYKIYIDGFYPKDLKPHLYKLEQYYRKAKKYTELVSEQGVIILEGGKMYKQKVVDVPVTRKDNLLIDKSVTNKEFILSQIPYDHFCNEIVAKYYGYSAEIMLVIEGKYEGPSFEPINFYFLANEWVNLENPLIAEELDWFLSVLK